MKTPTENSRLTTMDEQPSPPLPERIGKYTVLKHLGSGSTSEVYLCLDPFHQKEVAIKRIHSNAMGNHDAMYAARFFSQEAALVGRLQHPNVVEILDASDDPEGPYVVMEYVNGSTLRAYSEPAKLLPLDLVVEIGFKCAMALDYVAKQGLIHRDIKPANILTTFKNKQISDVKISDFGSAWDISAESTQVFRVGSLSYMSPEQIEGHTVTAQTDMYSLGAVLYQLIAGRPPFEAKTQGALIHQILSAEPVSLRVLRDGVSEALDAVVQHALAKRPEARYRHWTEFANALSTLVIGHAVPRGNKQQVLDSERFTLLRSLGFFKNFDDVAIWEVVHRAQWDQFAPGHQVYKSGAEDGRFYIIARGCVEVERAGKKVATLRPGSTIGEMAYLAPNPAMRKHTTIITATEPTTALSFTPDRLGRLSQETQHRFDKAFINVLVRRLHAAHEAMDHPRRIL